MCIHNGNMNIHNWYGVWLFIIKIRIFIIEISISIIEFWMSITELWIPITELLSHPVYRGWLNVFVPVRMRHCCRRRRRRRRRRRPQTFVHSITSEQLFGFLSFLVGLMALTCRLDYLIRFWSIFVVTVSLNWIFKVKYWICYNSATNVWLPRNEKQTYCLYSRH